MPQYQFPGKGRCGETLLLGLVKFLDTDTWKSFPFNITKDLITKIYVSQLPYFQKSIIIAELHITSIICHIHAINCYVRKNHHQHLFLVGGEVAIR